MFCKCTHQKKDVHDIGIEDQNLKTQIKFKEEKQDNTYPIAIMYHR
jgi:hypothetical protein